jgi:ribonuclease HI
MEGIDIDNIINDSYLNSENKLNNNTDTGNGNNINYKLLIFTDGGHERVKKRSSFGIYVICKDKHSLFYKYNETKIIKKINKDLILYKSNDNYIQFHSLFKNNTNEKCKFLNCNYFAIYSNNNDLIGDYCKLHKSDIMAQSMQFINYEPTNIRAEGLAIIYALIYLKNILILNLDKSDLVFALNNFNLNYNNLQFKEFNILNNDNTNYYQIITDSEFWINVITKWSNNWIKQNTIFTKKNLDLNYYINVLLNELLDNGHAIHFKFIRGHADKNNTEKKYNFYQKGNIIADKLANIAKENTNYNVKISFN